MENKTRTYTLPTPKSEMKIINKIVNIFVKEGEELETTTLFKLSEMFLEGYNKRYKTIPFKLVEEVEEEEEETEEEYQRIAQAEHDAETYLRDKEEQAEQEEKEDTRRAEQQAKELIQAEQEETEEEIKRVTKMKEETQTQKELKEVLEIIKDKNKPFKYYFDLLKGHNLEEGSFDFNYKSLCLTLSKDIKLIGFVEIYDKDELITTENVSDLMKETKPNKAVYDGYNKCSCGGDLEEIDQIIKLGDSVEFIFECLECKKKYLITSVSYIEEFTEQDEFNAENEQEEKALKSLEVEEVEEEEEETEEEEDNDKYIDNPRDYILSKIEEGYFTEEQILSELISWLDCDTLRDFINTSFGNEGF